MSHIFGRRCHLVKKFFGKKAPLFVAPKTMCTQTLSEAFRTPVSNPGDHKLDDVGLYYKVDNSLFLDVLFKDQIIDRNFLESCITFRETALMIREPALELIHYLKNANYDTPINRYVLYGKYGSGVTITLLQAIHYAYLSGWVIVHVPWVLKWSTDQSETVKSSEEGSEEVDRPIVGRDWLVHFKNQNEELLKKLDLKLHNTYTWNQQERNEKGESLLDLVYHGISRTKYSCAVITGLLEELKQHSRDGKMKMLVAIDGYSSLFQPFQKSKVQKEKYIPLRNISCLQAFKNIVKPDWHNGAAIVTCTSNRLSTNATDHLPMKQLTKEGFELLDPFVPIEITQLTEKEIMSALAYYRSQKWLLRSDGDEELKFLCAGNFLSLRQFCDPL